MIPKVVQDISQERWDNKLPSNSIFIQQYICQKLSTSVDVHWSYSVERHCRFFWDTVYTFTKLHDRRIRVGVGVGPMEFKL